MRIQKIILLVLCLLTPLTSSTGETLETFPSVLCDVLEHPIYKNTILFGSGKRELYLIQEDRDKTLLQHTDFNLIMDDRGFYALRNTDDFVLFSITEGEEDFVIIFNSEKEKYKISNCIQIAA